MNNRDEALLQLRGEAIGEIFPQSSKDEIFQNRTLRPILKLQNDLFIESFINYVNKSKSDFYNMGTEKKMAFIDKDLDIII